MALVFVDGILRRNTGHMPIASCEKGCRYMWVVLIALVNNTFCNLYSHTFRVGYDWEDNSAKFSMWTTPRYREVCRRWSAPRHIAAYSDVGDNFQRGRKREREGEREGGREGRRRRGREGGREREKEERGRGSELLILQV